MKTLTYSICSSAILSFSLLNVSYAEEDQSKKSLLADMTTEEIMELRKEAKGTRSFTSISRKKSIRARITGKDLDKGKVELTIANGKSFWLPVNDFYESDRRMIEAWEKDIRFLEVKVVGSGQGNKTILLSCKSGSEELTVKIYKFDKAHPITKTLQPNQSEEFKEKVSNKYFIKAYIGDTLVAEQSWNRKYDLSSF